jgi:arylsulfatase A-like enzyme
MYGKYSYLNDNRPFIAQSLQQSGFDTVGYHSNPHLGSEQNYDTGFDIFNDSAEGLDSVASLKDRVEHQLNPDSKIYSLLRRVWHYFTLTTDSSAYAKAPTITENAFDWFESEWKNEDPFFIWLHYMDAHYPFQPPEQFLEDLDIDPLPKRRVAELNGKMQEEPDELTKEDVDELLKLYKGEIRFTDHYIGKVLDELKERGILDETIVVVTADHGEAFGEHDRFGHHPLLYDELLRVPLIIHVPGIESRTIDQQVSLLDLGPTLYDLLGIETPDAVQGTSFAPLLRGEEMEEEVAIATGAGGKTLACRTSNWKCFLIVEEGRVELYDLQSDPDELRDISEEHPDIVAEFREQMKAYLDEAEATDIDLPKVEMTDEVEQRLRDLGYR